MFVDASVLVAILAREDDADLLAGRIAAGGKPYTSGLAVLEAATRLARMLDVDPVTVEERLQAAIETAGITVIAINNGIARKAVAAFARYGDGRGPAALSLGDCMAYACAEAYRLPLLTTSKHFAHTDIELA